MQLPNISKSLEKEKPEYFHGQLFLYTPYIQDIFESIAGGSPTTCIKQQ